MSGIKFPRCAATLLMIALISACASSGVGAPADGNSRARAESCKRGDTQIASRSQCLLDDAACYPLLNGSWCTGERGNTCPSGSKPLPADSQCPAGARCFKLGESLSCYTGG